MIKTYKKIYIEKAGDEFQVVLCKESEEYDYDNLLLDTAEEELRRFGGFISVPEALDFIQEEYPRVKIIDIEE